MKRNTNVCLEAFCFCLSDVKKTDKMCFFGAYRYAICGHTDFQIIVFCKNFMNPATIAGNPDIVLGPSCMPRIPDPRRSDMGNIVQYNMVLPDQTRAAAATCIPSQYYPAQGLQQADGTQCNDTGAHAQPPISGLCANCTAAAQQMTEIHQNEPNFGLSSEHILDANKMNTYFQYVNESNGNINNPYTEVSAPANLSNIPPRWAILILISSCRSSPT
jgi:hypothetical protein